MGLVLSSTATQTVRVPPELASLTTYLGTAARVGPAKYAWAKPPAPPSAASMQTYLAYHLHGDPNADRLGEIEALALVLHGTEDEEVPFGEARRLHAGLANASLVSIEGSEARHHDQPRCRLPAGDYRLPCRSCSPARRLTCRRLVGTTGPCFPGLPIAPRSGWGQVLTRPHKNPENKPVTPVKVREVQVFPGFLCCRLRGKTLWGTESSLSSQ